MIDGWYTGDPYNSAFHLRNIALLNCMWANDWTNQLGVLFPNAFAFDDQLVKIESAQGRPRCLFVKRAGTVWVFCLGAGDPGSDNWFFHRMVHGTNYRSKDGESAIAGEPGDAILAAVPWQFWDNVNTVYLVGHSWGGAIVQYMAVKFSFNLKNWDLRCFSYGAPRPGSSTFQERMLSIRNYRFYLTNDPVQWLPPHSNEFPWFSVLSTDNEVLHMNHQVHPERSVQIRNDGTLNNAQHGPLLDIPVTYRLAQFVFPGPGQLDREHTLEAYRLAWIKVPINYPVPATTTIRDRGEPEFEPTNREEAVLRRQGVAQIRNDLANPASPNHDIQVHRVPPTYRDRYYARKDGQVWIVLWQGEIIAVGPGKRSAKKTARDLNKSLRRVPA